MSANSELHIQIEKWKSRLDPLLKDLPDSEFTRNLLAYRSDTDHFLREKDFIRAFESIIWAWSLYELGKKYELFDKKF